MLTVCVFSLCVTSLSLFRLSFSSCLLLLILFPLSFFRKLPWLSRQSDRLLTDRSLVRSQAEASFLLFPPFLFLFPYFLLSDLCVIKKYASRGSRTHDRAVKSRALYRLS